MPIAGLLAAYVLGSTPFAYLAGRLVKGIDLRQHGSGNLGATNVFRTLGAPAGIIVFLLDALKGAIPTLFLARLFGQESSAWWPIAYGVAAIAGHVRPYAGLFRGGGKGVATAGGVFGALAPIPFVISLGTFAGAVFLTGYVSVGSLLAALVLTLAVLVQFGAGSPIFQMAAPICLLVFWTHRANIARLRQGTESRIRPPRPVA